MWLHVPGLSESSPCAQGWADSTTASASRSQMLARSAWSRGKVLRPRAWLRKCERESWMTALFGQICEPSTAQRGVESWIRSLPGCPVHQCLSPAGDSGPLTNDGSGLMPVGLSERSSRPGCSSKTCRACTLGPANAFDAYAAGLIDGEGSITLGPKLKGRYKSYVIQVGVEMSIKAITILNQMHKVYGGTMGINRQKGQKHSSTAAWRIFGSNAACFLYRVFPFLMLKQKQAEIVIKLLERREEVLENGTTAWTEARLKAFASETERIHALNAKGPTPVFPGETALRVGNRWVSRTVDLFGERWETFSGPWPHWGSMRNGCVYRRKPLDLHKSGRDGSVWATPTTRDHKDGADPSEKAATESRLGRQAPRMTQDGKWFLPLTPNMLLRFRLNWRFAAWLMGLPLAVLTPIGSTD